MSILRKTYRGQRMVVSHFGFGRKRSYALEVGIAFLGLSAGWYFKRNILHLGVEMALDALGHRYAFGRIDVIYL